MPAVGSFPTLGGLAVQKKDEKNTQKLQARKRKAVHTQL